MNRDHRDSQTTALTIVIGLVVAALYLDSGCTAVDDGCMTDDGQFICNIEDCVDDEVFCQDEFEGREVVDNWMAKPGDVTISPFTGLKFLVERDSSRISYQGYSFVFECSGECIDIVEANPGVYLDELVEEAGPASDPDHTPGGAIDDDEDEQD